MSGLKSWTMRNVLLPLSLAPTRSRYLRLARTIERRQYWPLGEIHSLQLSSLRDLVQRAQRDSAFYREKFAQARVDRQSLNNLADFSNFPLTTKQDIENNFPDGMTALDQRTPDWHYVGTRGTTRRVMVIHDFAKRDAERAYELVVMSCDSPFSLGDSQVAIPPDACSTHCGLESSRAERVRDQLLDLVTRRKTLNRDSISDLRGLIMDRWIRCYRSLPPMQPDADDKSLAEYVAILRDARPRQLVALPEYLRALAAYVEHSGDRPPRIEVLRPMGANLPVSWKASIEAAFEGTVRETYGSREMGPMAFDCRYCHGLHVLMDQFLIEVVDADLQPVADGDLGQVLITDLHNLTMPILRYRIGDLARIYREKCSCGRATMRLAMEGRMEDAFMRDSGRVLTTEQVSNFLFETFGIDQFELTESEDLSLQLRYVRPKHLTQDDASVGRQLSQWCDLGSEIRIRSTLLIRPESSGKYRHCKSSSYQLWLRK